MANGVALLELAQDVHWMRAGAAAQQIQTMRDDDCHAALDLIEIYCEVALEEALFQLIADGELDGAEPAAALLLVDLIGEIGPGWLQYTPLVCALRDRSLASVFA